MKIPQTAPSARKAHRAARSSALTLALLARAPIARADAPPRLLDAAVVEAPADAALPTDAAVVLRFTVDPSGAVRDVEVLTGVRADIDARVVTAALAMRFSPAERAGHPIAARLRFRFRLQRAAPAIALAAPVPVPPPSPFVTAPRVTPGGTRPARPRTVASEDSVTVRGHHEPGAATRMTFRGEELTTVPGTFGEPLRIVATQPGVARTPFGLGFFVVRGASFESTGFFVDGYPVLILYHLAAGPAVLSSRLVGELDFYPGGYPLQYGRFSAGVIALETRPPPTDRRRAEAEVDVFRASVLGVAPFDHGRGSVAVALRRSYYDFLLPLIQPGVAVNYTDGQLRADYRFSDRLRASLFAFASGDYFDRTQAVGSGATVGQARDSLRYNFGRIIAKLEYRAPDGLFAQLSAMLGFDDTGLITSDPGRPNRGVNAAGHTVGQRASVRFATGPALTTTVGLDTLAYVYDVSLSFGSPQGFGAIPMPQSNPRVAALRADVTQLGVAGYVEETLRTSPAEITAGTRLEALSYQGNAHVVADPRIVARVRVHERATVIAATGLFHQPPPFFSLVPQVGNPNLLPQRAWQSSVGVEATLPLALEARLTGFFSRMWQLPRATYAFIDTPQGPRRAFALSDGEGRAYGLEVQLRRRLERGVYGWLSYTLSRSERFIGDGRVVPFTYDQTHVLNAAVSWDVTPQWRVGARFQLATGSPTSRVMGGLFDADADGYRPQYVSEDDRLPTYHQLDVRVDYKFHAGPVAMAAFLDVLNVYYAQNAEGWVYQYDYLDRRPRPGLPILPALGIRGEL